MEDGVAIARCLRNAGKGNTVEALKVYERIRYRSPFPIPCKLPVTGLTTDTTESTRYKRWEKTLEIDGIKLTGMPL
jgi:hypothetical protein